MEEQQNTELFDTAATTQDDHRLKTGDPNTRRGDKIYSIGGRLLRRMLAAMGDPPLRILLGDGEEISIGQTRPIATVIIHDKRALLKLLINPDLHFGDAFSSGRIAVQGNLVEFLKAARWTAPAGFLKRHTLNGSSKVHSNNVSGSRKNIHHHYDIGNAFYKLWLDEEMVYTCAYFPTSSATLEEAQRAKMEHVCRKVELKAGQTVVEAGCGWGALARYMAKHYGVKVRAYNISSEQIAYARERAKAEGLSHQVEYIEEDYRNISGQFDAFVSVGMLEHVGRDHYRTLGEVIHRSLKPLGRGLIHSIGRNRPGPMNRWIERRIFPGAYPPSLREMMDIFEPREFSVLDVENLRLHYAKTLEHWLQRFESASPKVKAMYDEAFTRAWRLYLAGSIAAFTVGSLQLFQITFARPTDNTIPWTRAHLYTG